jgi:hypothetical protein
MRGHDLVTPQPLRVRLISHGSGILVANKKHLQKLRLGSLMVGVSSHPSSFRFLSSLIPISSIAHSRLLPIAALTIFKEIVDWSISLLFFIGF